MQGRFVQGLTTIGKTFQIEWATLDTKSKQPKPPSYAPPQHVLAAGIGDEEARRLTSMSEAQAWQEQQWQQAEQTEQAEHEQGWHGDWWQGSWDEGSWDDAGSWDEGSWTEPASSHEEAPQPKLRPFVKAKAPWRMSKERY